MESEYGTHVRGQGIAVLGAETPGSPTGQGPVPVIRTDVELRPDARRVIVKPFLPSEQIFPDGGLLRRVIDLTEEEVAASLAEVIARFEGRHRDLTAILESHFRYVAAEAGELPEMSPDRRLLIGAYYTHEFSIEAAALTNPSIVPAPDQSGLEPGTRRFIISLRGIGEGHISSIEFRSGVIDAGGAIAMDEVGRSAVAGSRVPPVFDWEEFLAELAEMGALNRTARSLMGSLPDPFGLDELEAAVVKAEGTRSVRHLSDKTSRVVHWLATSSYETSFPTESEISERVIFPGSVIESHGLEDARFVRFTDDDGSVTYYATYTAYDGFQVLPQLIETADFVSFRIFTLSGACAQNKGAALFPRKIDGRFVALSRFDAENNYVMHSDSLRVWDEAVKIESPELAWDLARIGNCGSPLETEAGWLVITHGVGPMRTYSLGAILLDIDDPSRMIGRLQEPLLVPSEMERDGYVPNVVYSCGSMIHGSELILPYGVSDRATRIARVPLEALLARLTG